MCAGVAFACHCIIYFKNKFVFIFFERYFRPSSTQGAWGCVCFSFVSTFFSATFFAQLLLCSQARAQASLLRLPLFVSSPITSAAAARTDLLSSQSAVQVREHKDCVFLGLFRKIAFTRFARFALCLSVCLSRCCCCHSSSVIFADNTKNPPHSSPARARRPQIGYTFLFFTNKRRLDNTLTFLIL